MLGVLGVVFVGLSAVYLYFRYDNYAMLRELIRRQAQASLGGDLALDGPIDIEVGDDTRIFLRNITLTNPEPGFLRSVIAIEEARIAVPTGQAAGRDFSGAEIDLYGVRVEIARDGADGVPQPPTDLEAAAAARGIDLPAFQHIRAHDVELALMGLWGGSFDLVTLVQRPGGGFSADLQGKPGGLDSAVTLEASPLSDATPGAAWRVSARFGGSDIEMLAEIRAVRRLFARIGVESRLLRAADIAALSGPANAPRLEGGKPLFSAADPIPAAWAGIVDASLHVTVARFEWDDATAETVSLQAKLERGRLAVAPAGAKLGQGGIDASARLDLSALPAALEVSVRMAQASAGLAAPVLGAAGPWQGTLDGSINASAQGATFGALSMLAGQASLRVRQGMVDASAHGMAGRESIARLFYPDQPTPVPCLALEGRFGDGQLALANGTLVTGLGRLAADGAIDWRGRTLDISIVTAPDAGPERLTTRHSRLSGSLDAPVWAEEVLQRRWLAVARPSAACVVAAVAPR